MSSEIKISTWIENRLATGNYSFTLKDLKQDRNNKTDTSTKRALSRLVKQEKIISIHKGFYIIIPPTYKNKGILPPVMFIDNLMGFLDRPYYLSLLSAAAIFGAAHQQPQVNYICTTLPSVRTTKKKGVVIKYISKRKFPNEYIIQKKTESGYINVSNPILTCIDLINYHKTIGGINRAATIINELSEEIDVKNINKQILNISAKADLQRLGYFWDHEIDQSRLADKLFSIIKDQTNKLRSCKLINSKKKKKNKDTISNRWKINVNTTIEIDE
jgi:predicted transcriptional regulator of viral defense system